MDLSAKLAVCEVAAPSIPSIPVRDLLEPAKIVGARRVPTRFNRPAIMLEVVLTGGERRVTFLPARFDNVISDEDLAVMAASKDFSVKCTGVVGRSPSVSIFKQ